MMTIEELRRLDPEARMQRFEELLARRYPRGVSTGLARDLDLHPKTLFKWRKSPGSMPFSVLLSLELLFQMEELTEELGRAAGKINPGPEAPAA